MKTAFISRIIQLGNTDAQSSVADCTWQIEKRSMVNPTDFDILYWDVATDHIKKLFLIIYLGVVNYYVYFLNKLSF